MSAYGPALFIWRKDGEPLDDAEQQALLGGDELLVAIARLRAGSSRCSLALPKREALCASSR